MNNLNLVVDDPFTFDDLKSMPKKDLTHAVDLMLQRKVSAAATSIGDCVRLSGSSKSRWARGSMSCLRMVWASLSKDANFDALLFIVWAPQYLRGMPLAQHAGDPATNLDTTPSPVRCTENVFFAIIIYVMSYSAPLKKQILDRRESFVALFPARRLAPLMSF